MKKNSLADVADSLGVSKTLISLVLNGRGDEKGINKDTQKRVLAKVKELNYSPNQFARGLRIGKSFTLGLIVADISNSFYANICRSVEDIATQNGYNVIICSSDEDEDKENELIQMLRVRQVDGIIVATTRKNPEIFKEMLKEGFPFVLIDRYFSELKSNAVIVDNNNGAQQAVKHLVANRKRRIGCLAISPAHLSSIKERIEGYKEGLAACNIEFNPDLLHIISHHNIKKEVNNVLSELVLASKSVDAIFTLNNVLAVSSLYCLKKTFCRIPEDIAVIAFDDISAFTLCDPRITVISQPVQDIGINASKLLLQQLKAGKEIVETEKIILKTALIIRDSCGKK